MITRQPKLLRDLEELHIEVKPAGGSGRLGRVNQVWVQFDLRNRIVRAQTKDNQKIKEQIENRELKELHIDNGVIKYGNRICVPQIGELRKEIMREAHNTLYTAHPGSTKMYQNLRHNFWWNGIKRDIAEFVQKCQVCQ